MKILWIAVLFVLSALFFFTLCKAGESPGRRRHEDEDEIEFMQQLARKKERRKMRK